MVSRVSVSGFIQALYFPALAFQPAPSAQQHQYALRELHAEQEVVRTTSARSSGWHRAEAARLVLTRMALMAGETRGSAPDHAALDSQANSVRRWEVRFSRAKRNICSLRGINYHPARRRTWNPGGFPCV